jgi:hypothetical protein
MAKLQWRKQKTLAMLANRKQWQREFSVDESTESEIELEQGGYLVIESSAVSSPTYIITE